MKRIVLVIIGLVIVAVGVIWGLNALEITDIDIFFDGWWTLFIIIPCFCSLFTRGNKIAALTGIALGIALLLASQKVFPFAMIWKVGLPVLVVSIGLSIMIKALIRVNRKPVSIHIEATPGKSHVAVFSGKDVSYNDVEFDGTSLITVFGGIDCDLRNAIFTKDVRLEALAVFGGTDIHVPSNVNVEINSNAVFGSVDAPKLPHIDGAPTLYIEAAAIFGGIEVK